MPRTKRPISTPPPAVDEGPLIAPAPLQACPYLASAGRSWVASAPSTDHRCAAVAPEAPLTLEKQRRLCLTPRHESCATFTAAIAARLERDPGNGNPTPGWGWVRTTPVVDGSVGLGASLAAVIAERRGWQVVPAIALVGVLAALGLSNLGATAPSPSLTALATTPTSATAEASPTSTALASPTAPSTRAPTATPAPTPAATARPTPTPAPASRTYTVRSGDTLYDIARKFGVSVGAIQQLNGMRRTGLHVGQVLKIP